MLKNYKTYEALQINGRAVPEALEPPPILEGYETWLEAFWELSTDRAQGLEKPGPIPAASIARHTQGWDPEEADFFRIVIRALDRTFLAGEDYVIPPVQVDGPDVDEGKPAPNLARDNFRALFKR